MWRGPVSAAFSPFLGFPIQFSARVTEEEAGLWLSFGLNGELCAIFAKALPTSTVVLVGWTLDSCAIWFSGEQGNSKAGVS